ncbi:MAG TPA: hypothetical protein VGL35_00255 [Rhizomicrobium sp.]
MHARHGMLFGTALVALAAALQADAATLVPVTPPPGATQTIVFGINKHAVITGSYIDSNGVTHGFFGPLNGTYTTFDYGNGTTGTAARAIDDDGNITGFAEGPNYVVGVEFFREDDGTLKTIEKDGAPLDGVAQGIIKKDETSTGDYVDPDTGVRNGYLAKDGNYLSDVNLGRNVYSTNPRALNWFGTLAGFYYDPDGTTSHGFILKNGIVQVVDADDSGTTALEGINKKEFAAGQVIDSQGEPHAFTYDNRTGVFTTIDVPDGSPGQQAWGVNDKGQVAVSTNSGNSYIYCLKNVLCPRGGRTIPDGRSWTHAAALHYGRNGRTSAKAAASRPTLHGARR